MKIRVAVKPGAPFSRLEKMSDTEFKAYLKALPEKGKANEELIKLLAKELKVPAQSIRIKTKTSRNKVVEIHNN